jgi:hypothetical protein
LDVNYDSEFYSPTPSKVKLGPQGIFFGLVVVPFKISGLPQLMMEKLAGLMLPFNSAFIPIG